jgi:hypothetical protein
VRILAWPRIQHTIKRLKICFITNAKVGFNKRINRATPLLERIKIAAGDQLEIGMPAQEDRHAVYSILLRAWP